MEELRNFVLRMVFVSMVAVLLVYSVQRYIQVFLPNGVSITAEVAVTDEERQQGLMFREKINPDQGMLFVFKQEGIQSFWMKNMQFSIDILWLDKDKRIIYVEENVPPCFSPDCPSYACRIPSIYVLELKAGSVAEQGLRLYDRLDFILDPDS